MVDPEAIRDQETMGDQETMRDQEIGTLVQDLSWKFLRMYPLKDMTWKDIGNVLSSLEYDYSMSLQQKILGNTLHHPIATRYPPTENYARIFLKGLIDQIEACDHEVCEDLYLAYTDLLTAQTTMTDFCYRTYKMHCPLTLRETRKLIADGTTGMITWEASHVLAEWCCKESHLLNKKVLELGAGLGLTGLAVIKSCKPKSYTFTDLPASVLATLRHNVEINLGCGEVMEGSLDCSDWKDNFETVYEGVEVAIRRLDWAEPLCDMDADVILAADVVYDPDLVMYLTDTLKAALQCNTGAVAYIASTMRNPDTYAFFKSTLDKKDIRVLAETIHEYQESPSQPQSSVAILELAL